MVELSVIARRLDAADQLTPHRARILQLASDPERADRYKCSHPELGGAGWSHPWPDQEMFGHACCRVREHCPPEWAGADGNPVARPAPQTRE